MKGYLLSVLTWRVSKGLGGHQPFLHWIQFLELMAAVLIPINALASVHSASVSNVSEGEIIFIGILLVALAGYFYPAINAFKRAHPNRWLILCLNSFLGATGLVWFICLLWSYHKIHDAKAGGGSCNGGESGLNIYAGDVQKVAIVEVPLESRNIDNLERFCELYQKKVLTKEEFESQKQKLLRQ